MVTIPVSPPISQQNFEVRGWRQKTKSKGKMKSVGRERRGKSKECKTAYAWEKPDSSVARWLKSFSLKTKVQ
jgi:hypothetical protein